MRALTIAFVVTIMAGSSVTASPVAYQKLKVGHVWVQLVTVDLTSPQVRIAAAIAGHGRGSSESFSSIIARTKPKAAITGTFFDTRSLLPIGDIAVDGRLLHSGCYRAAICVSPDNKAQVAYRRRGEGPKWTGFETVVSGGITLVRHGRIALAPKAEGFHDRSLFRPNPRTAVGVTKAGKLILVTVKQSIYLRDLAHVMIKLNALDAIALDGGSSTGLYYAGKVTARPSRRLTNVLLVYDSVSSYEEARSQFAPALLMAKAPSLQPTAANRNGAPAVSFSTQK